MSIFNLADVQGKRGINCTVYNTMEHYVVYFKTLADQIELPLCKKFDSAFRFKLESFTVWYEKLMSRHHQVFLDYERQSLMELKIGFEKFVKFHFSNTLTLPVIPLIRRVFEKFQRLCDCGLCVSTPKSTNVRCIFKLRRGLDDGVRNFVHQFNYVWSKMPPHSDAESERKFFVHLHNYVNWTGPQLQLTYLCTSTAQVDFTSTTRSVRNKLYKYQYAMEDLIKKPHLLYYHLPLLNLVRKIFDHLLRYNTKRK